MDAEYDTLMVRVAEAKRRFEDRYKIITANLYDYSNSRLVSWDHLSELDMNVPTFAEIAKEKKDILITRLSSDTKTLVFHVFMDKGAVMPPHYHDSMEIITVIKGKLSVKKDAGLVLDQVLNNSIVLVDSEVHSLESLEETQFISVLNKPK